MPNINSVERAIAAAGITKLELSRELDMGTSTIWRACKGKKIDAESARKLRDRFPSLDFEQMTLGTESADPATDDGASQ